MATKKTTIGKTVKMFRTLDMAKLSKMDTAQRFALIKAMRPMKKVARDFEDFREDAFKRLRPEGFDKVDSVISRLRGMTEPELSKAIAEPANADAVRLFNAYNRDVEGCLGEEAAKETELDFEPLTDEAFGALLESNGDWAAGLAMELQDILCAEG